MSFYLTEKNGLALPRVKHHAVWRINLCSFRKLQEGVKEPCGQNEEFLCYQACGTGNN